MAQNDKTVLLIGGGGHCKSVYDSLMRMDSRMHACIVDVKPPVSMPYAEYAGTDDDLQSLYEEGYRKAFIAVGSVGNTFLRRKLAEKVNAIGFELINIIDPSSIVSVRAELGKGIFAGKNTVINADSIISDHAIVNTAAVVEHDCDIGAFVHISPRAVLCGSVKIENDVHIGAGSTVIQGVTVGEYSIIGAGSVVIRNFAAHRLGYGDPCREVKEI